MDKNGLIYMRARYYSPDMKRFVNADIIAGQLSNAITLNRYAYANGNPVSFVDPFGLSAWDWVKNKWNQVKECGVNAAIGIGNTAVNAYNTAKDWAVDTYNDVKERTVNTYNEVKDWAVDTYNDAKDGVVTAYNDTKNAVISAGSWVNNNVIKPVGETFSNVGRQIKDGFTTVANAIAENVGAKASAGKEKTINTDYYYFATVEKGIGYSKSFGNEKPITFFASAGENWWEFWEWSVGIDVNIDGYGGGFSLGLEKSINIHAGNVSHEVGRNALGRISYKIACNSGDGYAYSKYSLNGPETALAVVGVVALIYCVPALIPAIGAGAPALAGAMG